ncbi:MAG: hypothetical protein ACR2NO_03800 [Chloroflexota bacterium]
MTSRCASDKWYTTGDGDAWPLTSSDPIGIDWDKLDDAADQPDAPEPRIW